MEELRPEAARKLGKRSVEVQLPHDLVALMSLDQLWSTLSQDINVMAFEVCLLIMLSQFYCNYSWKC